MLHGFFQTPDAQSKKPRDYSEKCTVCTCGRGGGWHGKGERVAWKGRGEGGGMAGKRWGMGGYIVVQRKAANCNLSRENTVQYSVQYRYTVFLRKIDTSLKLLLSRGRTTNNLVAKILFCFAKLLGFFMDRSFV